MLDLVVIQDRAWRNKVAKGFNTTNVPKEIIFLMVEIGEAAGAWAHGDLVEFGDELADTVIFAACVARMAQVDLPDVLLTGSDLPDLPTPSDDDVEQVLLLMFREGAAIGASWRFADLEELTRRIDRVILAACRLARMHAINLVAAIERKLDVNDAREYARDPRSGRLVKAVR